MAKKKVSDGSVIEFVLEIIARIINLIVVRESDVSDQVLMQSMVDKTLYGCSDIPGVALAKTYGLEPFTRPEDFGAQVRITKTHKMVLFAVEGTLFLYAMGSAAKEDSEESGNDFLGFLMEILTQYRPEVMTLANITRLMRSTRRIGELQDVLSKVGCILRLDGGARIDVREPSGSMQFMLMSTFAAFERDHIVLRMLAGLVASAGRNGMHFRPEHLPLGYVLKDKVVMPDPARKKDVQAMLTILAQTMTRREKAEAMSAAGIRFPRSFGNERSDNPSDARDMKSFIKGIEPWLDLYQSGVHTVQRENPFFGLDRIGIAPVIRENDTDRGYIELSYKWGLPEGGWASDELFAMARASFKGQKVYGSGATGHLIRKPFLGLINWTDEQSNQWTVDSHCLTEYRLRRRQYREGARRGWAEPTLDGQIVARIDSATLHRSIADGIQEAITEGVALEHLQGQFVGEFSKSSFAGLEQVHRIRALELEVGRLRRSAAKARGIALGLAEDQDASPWISDAVDSERQADVIKMKIKTMGDEAKVVAELEKQIPADLILCAKAVSVLRGIKTNAPRAVSEALRQILKDITMEVTDEGKVRWKLFVLLPSQEGALRLGPICGEVEPVLPKFLVIRSPLTTKPRTEAALNVLKGGGTFKEAMAKVPEWSGQRTVGHVRTYLIKAGVPAIVISSLLNARVPELRSVVIGAVLYKPNLSEKDLPEVVAALDIPGCTSEWAEHVLRCYLFSKKVVFPVFWLTQLGRRQLILDALLELGGEASIEELQEKLGGSYTRPELTSALFSPRLYRRQHDYFAIAVQGTPYEKVSGRITSESRVGLVPCVHCGGWASRLVVVPEVSRHLLCPTCRRMPSADSPIFPESYLKVVFPISGKPTTAWAHERVPKAAEDYLANLSEAQRKTMEFNCRKCQKTTHRMAPGVTLCPECTKSERAKGKSKRAKTKDS